MKFSNSNARQLTALVIAFFGGIFGYGHSKELLSTGGEFQLLSKSHIQFGLILATMLCFISFSIYILSTNVRVNRSARYFKEIFSTNLACCIGLTGVPFLVGYTIASILVVTNELVIFTGFLLVYACARGFSFSLLSH